MSSGYPAPPVHHSQAFPPEMPGPSAHHPGYAQLPPPMSFNYQQDPITNPHRTNMPPPRTNMAPPNMPGPRDRAGELTATENGVGGAGPNSLTSKPGAEEKDKPAPQPIEGTDTTRKYR